MRAIRRKRTLEKQAQRQRLMDALGMQAGTIYARHRQKIQLSTGYMSMSTGMASKSSTMVLL